MHADVEAALPAGRNTMKADSVRICPACGTRNKPKWEYCVKCGESLQDIPLGIPADGATAAAEADTEVVSEAGPFPWVALVASAVLIAAAIYFFRTYRGDEGRPDPGAWTAPTVPPTRPAAATYVPGAGEKDLQDGRNLLAQGDVTGALRVLAQAVADAPSDPTARYAYAQALWQAGDKDQALVHYREAARLSPKTLTYRADLAKALAAGGRNAEAIDEFEAAVAIEPGPGSLQALATLYAAAGSPAKALDALRRAASVAPNSAVIQQDLAHALEKAGNTSQAIEAYQKVLDLNPKATNSRGLLADLLFRENRKDEAIDLVRDGIAQNPQAPRLHRDLASLLERSDRIPEAIAEYREYARLAPQSADAKQLEERAEFLEKKLAGQS
jgi:tetratricopeptide (TPR) repeat protein